jgi:hypothetical protein
MKIAKDTVLFEKGDIKLTADDVKIYIADCDGIGRCALSVYVDISKFYKVTQVIGNKHRIKKLIHFGDIQIKTDINSISSCKSFRFINNDCELRANDINRNAIYDESLTFLFISDCRRNDYYKKHIAFADLDRIKHYMINYSILSYDIRETFQLKAGIPLTASKRSVGGERNARSIGAITLFIFTTIYSIIYL